MLVIEQYTEFKCGKIRKYGKISQDSHSICVTNVDGQFIAIIKTTGFHRITKHENH